MPKRRKLYSETVTSHGVEVRVFERKVDGPLYVAVKGERTRSESGKQYTAREVRSLKHSDRELALNTARAMAAAIAERRLLGYAGDLSFGQLKTQYELHRAPLLSPTRRRAVTSALRLFQRHLGDGFPIADFDEHRVKTYVAARQSGQLAPDDHRARKNPAAGTIRNELHIFRTVCRWGAGFKRNGKGLLPVDPFRTEELRRAVPSEVNPRRPVATRERFAALTAVAGQVDSAGCFALMLELAWRTGRRINAICHLTAADIHMTHDAAVAAIQAAGQDSALAANWSGAIHWSSRWDKMAYTTFCPLTPGLRAALHAYMRRHAIIGDAPLFAHRCADRSCKTMKARAAYLLIKAEQVAGLPHIPRGGWHAFRRGWATLRKSLSMRDVMAAGGWRDAKALATAYQQADSAGVAAVMDVA
jgi:integrase